MNMIINVFNNYLEQKFSEKDKFSNAFFEENGSVCQFYGRWNIDPDSLAKIA